MCVNERLHEYTANREIGTGMSVVVVVVVMVDTAATRVEATTASASGPAHNNRKNSCNANVPVALHELKYSIEDGRTGAAFSSSSSFSIRFRWNWNRIVYLLCANASAVSICNIFRMSHNYIVHSRMPSIQHTLRTHFCFHIFVTWSTSERATYVCCVANAMHSHNPQWARVS